MTRKSAMTHARFDLIKDLFLIVIGAVIAIVLAKSGFIDMMVNLLGGSVIASFVAGIFFTSAFTLAPAAVALVYIGQSASDFTIILWGALGAMCGDLALFLFIRDRFAVDLVNSMRPSFVKHVAKSFHFGLLKWLSPLIGAAAIASPLPDEFGLALLGISRARVYILLPIAFFMNMINIYFLLLFRHVIA